MAASWAPGAAPTMAVLSRGGAPLAPVTARTGASRVSWRPLTTMRYVMEALDRSELGGAAPWPGSLPDAGGTSMLVEESEGGGCAAGTGSCRERIRVVCSRAITSEHQGVLQGEIAQVVKFTQNLALHPGSITFHHIAPAEAGAARGDATLSAGRRSTRTHTHTHMPATTSLTHTPASTLPAPDDACAGMGGQGPRTQKSSPDLARSPKMNRVGPSAGGALKEPAGGGDERLGGREVPLETHSDPRQMEPLTLGSSSQGHGGAEHGEEDVVYVLVVGLNAGVAARDALDSSTLNELCEPESVSWQQLVDEGGAAGGAAPADSCCRLSLSWANYNVPNVSTDEDTVLCCGREEGKDGPRGWGGVSMYYPRHLQEFHRVRALQQPEGRWRMLQRVLEDHVDAIRFHEW
jgi:hypothetical protein